MEKDDLPRYIFLYSAPAVAASIVESPLAGVHTRVSG